MPFPEAGVGGAIGVVIGVGAVIGVAMADAVLWLPRRRDQNVGSSCSRGVTDDG